MLEADQRTAWRHSRPVARHCVAAALRGFQLDRSGKAFELGQYLVRLFRGLDALMGSDDAASMSWLRTVNLDLDGRPIDLIRTVRGLSDVADYVDDHRARV